MKVEHTKGSPLQLFKKEKQKTKIMSTMSTHNDNPMQTGGEETEETTDVVFLGLKIH